jgi:multiple sugar transport system ATP-binding protein
MSSGAAPLVPPAMRPTRTLRLLGVRPTDLVVGAARDLQLSGSVFLVEPVGPVTYVDVDLGGPTLKATCDPDRAPAAGDRVSLGFAAGRVRLFDPTGEDRL